MSQNKVVIIGGGIAGLYAAWCLQQRGIPYLLLEANSILGGRISSKPTIDNTKLAVDLGPTWVWPHQKRILGLLTQLEVKYFEQYCQGDVLYQMDINQPVRRTYGSASMLSYRVHGGTQKLIAALTIQLQEQQLKTNHPVTSVSRAADQWLVMATNDGTEQPFYADQLLLALPPRMIVKYLTPHKWLSQPVIDDLSRQQTWMSAQAKFIAVYKTPFWREAGLAGQAFSQVGPMVEIHDATACDDGGFALFGFIGLPVPIRKKLGDINLIRQCQQQLVTIFGQEALTPQASYLVDWSEQRWITTSEDIAESPRHAAFNLHQFQTELSALNVNLVGSEFAQSEAGYIEGALIAVDKSMQEIMGKIV
ncbi:MAG: monoamine oxidase [Paraglaciecola sp.]|jgi:monoamine oxidase